MSIYYLTVGVLVNISFFISCTVFAANTENNYYLKYKPKKNNLVSKLAFQPDPGESSNPAKTAAVKAKEPQKTAHLVQKTQKNVSGGPPQPAMPPPPAHLAQPSIPSLPTPKTKSTSAAKSVQKENPAADIVTSTIKSEFAYYLISDFDFPDDHELHLKIWKDGKESDEYYIFHKGIGIVVEGKTVRYPYVDSLCCIKYGEKGKLNPFSIDLNKDGKGLTDLPGCKVKKAYDPSDSLNVQLPDTTPDYNM